VRASLFGEQADADMTIEENVQTFADRFFKDFNEVKNQSPSSAGIWYLDTSVEVIMNTQRVVCLAMTDNQYTGGAHGNSGTAYISFDARTGRPLGIDDLIFESAETAFLQLVEDRFRKIRGLSSGQSLEDAGFWFREGSFHLARQFGVNPEGIVFTYNNYEVAPYAMGPTTVQVLKEDLVGMTRDPLLWY
jgi:hypothetical protein